MVGRTHPLANGVGILHPNDVTLPALGHTPLRRGEAIVYRLLNADLDCIYIGHTTSPLNRWQGHRGKPWWPEVAFIYYAREFTEARAREVECGDIHAERPLYDRTLGRK